ncbi:MAG: bifunctional [glutamate--ammonia ligase]-adenylyl-L-tyrosine phosphorylase/[glutamate--ammonia-ligase] adenylyltransferase [Thermodesulfobacteriota bacterium]
MIQPSITTRAESELFDQRVKDRLAACRQAAEDCGIFLPETSEFADDLGQAFALSDFIAKSCIRKPSMLKDLIDSAELEINFDPDHYDRRVKAVCDAASDEEQLGTGLRRLRNREMVRIAWRDLSGRCDLFETMSDLSALADACLIHALDFLHHLACERYGCPVSAEGVPQQLVVLGMGKLGGRELNFSSDIDLIFAYPEAGETEGGPSAMPNEEFFTRLCRRVIDVLAKSTVEGSVFRVDTRLRPYGDAGPLVMSFDGMENYYQTLGREWERYALIKARVIAGDVSAGQWLLERLQPFVFRRYLDYGTFESLREMKNKIERQVIRKGLSGNIKHGTGGIREIEFFGQIFQLIRGGIDPRYRERRLLKVLLVMMKDRCIARQVYEELFSAYIFLRNTEHRLQMYDDMQTHSLPAEAAGQMRLAVAMGFADWPAFHKQLTEHMDRVHSHFHELLSPEIPEAEDDEQIETVWQHPEDRARNRKILETAGFDEPEAVLCALDNLREAAESTDIASHSRERLDRLMPQMLRFTIETDRPVLVFTRLMSLIESILRRSCYISLLLENPGALQHLVRLARISPWIVSFLSSHPLLLDELLDVRTLYDPLDKAALSAELSERLSRIAEDDVEMQMDELRVFKQVNTFRIVAADVTGNLPLMKVSDRLTYLAETILAAALDLTWRHLVERYGRPSHLNGAADGEMGFACIAYGKLGGFELGYGSDLDLVFLHTAQQGHTEGGRLKSIFNSEFYARLGQRIIHFLSAPTSTGKLYEADLRLRPSGNAGVLVSHIDGFEQYQRRDAWTWEHQALIKARPIIGDEAVLSRFAEIREQVIAISRDPAVLRDTVVRMREKMRKAHVRAKPGRFDLKQDPGGIIDIEFLVQYLILLHADQHAQLRRWTDVVRQLNALALSDIIDDLTAHSLKQAYLIYRYFVHRLNLQEKPAILPEKRFRELRRRVNAIWARYLATGTGKSR